MKKEKYILKFSQVGIKDIGLVGGKNASLGEMYSRLTKQGINVPDGFCVTASAYQYFLNYNKIKNKIKDLLTGLDATNTVELVKRGKLIRKLIIEASVPDDLQKRILEEYQILSKKYKSKGIDVAVRSSATAEDLPTASFAGQLESYLNISGSENLIKTIKLCFASLFTDRAISYRQDKKFPHFKVNLSVGVQKMVRSDLASSGVMFTLDTESGFRDLIIINASLGLGENIVKGRVAPDEYFVYKKTFEKGFEAIIKKQVGSKKMKMIYSPQNRNATKNIFTTKEQRQKFALDNKDILQLAKWGMQIEKYFKKPMDIEWAKDGQDKKLYIVQARPETIYGKEDLSIIEEFKMLKKGKVLIQGVSVGNRIGQGKVNIIKDIKQITKFKQGEVLVAKMTDPAWEPIMKKASAIITDSGGRTCHAAIVSRELGIPCIVGAQRATQELKPSQFVTVDCASSSIGYVYDEGATFSKKKINLSKIKTSKKVKIMMNVGNPYTAFTYALLPNEGIGLAREEFIITNYIKIHPLALLNYNKLAFPLKQKISDLTSNYSNKRQYYIDKLAEGIGQLAAAVYPKEIIVRFSDFKTNEYRELLGGSLYEPQEANPMLGWRGASRYYDEKFKPAFVMELSAIKKVIENFGLTNVSTMIPFVRSIEETQNVLKIMKEEGLEKLNKRIKLKKVIGGKVYLMCELPVNIILAKDFLKLVDGYSIGSNDLTQLILGVDRDSQLVSHFYNERNQAVKQSLEQVINIARKMKKKIGICGQAPSDFPDFAKFLVKNKIDSISLTPDSIIETLKKIG